MLYKLPSWRSGQFKGDRRMSEGCSKATMSEVPALDGSGAAQALGYRVLAPHGLFDEAFPVSEQLPRTLQLTFRESLAMDRGAAPVNVVRTYRGEDVLGDPLDDNSGENDDYRYHDVLHLAHMAVLGWSPTLRALLGAKRRSDTDTNRIQDGGRAAVLEEGLTAYVFSVARDRDLFAGADSVPPEVIAACQSMTAHLEVSHRSPADWEQAILMGYAALRQLIAHRHGVVDADLMARTLTFSPHLPATAKPRPTIALNQGAIVVFEGLDKAGKSSQRELLKAVVDLGSTTFAHMPSGFSSFTGRLYRLLESKPPSQPLARQLAHLSCHSEALPDLLEASRRGAVVLDRWWWSTVAYGWYATDGQLGLSEATFRSLIEEVWSPVKADVVFLFLNAHADDDNNTAGVSLGYEALANADRSQSVVSVPLMSESDTHDFVVTELLRRGIARPLDLHA